MYKYNYNSESAKLKIISNNNRSIFHDACIYLAYDSSITSFKNKQSNNFKMYKQKLWEFRFDLFLKLSNQ